MKNIIPKIIVIPYVKLTEYLYLLILKFVQSHNPKWIIVIIIKIVNAKIGKYNQNKITNRLEIKPDKRGVEKYELHRMVPYTFYSCDELKNDNNAPSAKIIFIKTVNGFDNLRDYVNHLKENGHKIRN